MMLKLWRLKGAQGVKNVGIFELKDAMSHFHFVYVRYFEYCFCYTFFILRKRKSHHSLGVLDVHVRQVLLCQT